MIELLHDYDHELVFRTSQDKNLLSSIRFMNSDKSAEQEYLSPRFTESSLDI